MLHAFGSLKLYDIAKSYNFEYAYVAKMILATRYGHGIQATCDTLSHELFD
jgi:hypothetical protein